MAPGNSPAISAAISHGNLYGRFGMIVNVGASFKGRASYAPGPGTSAGFAPSRGAVGNWHSNTRRVASIDSRTRRLPAAMAR